MDEGNPDEASRVLERWAPSQDDRYASYVESLRRASSKASSNRDPFRKRLSKSKFKVCLGKAARDLLGDFLIRSEHTAVLRILNYFVEVEEEGLKGVARLVDEDIELSPVALGVPTRSELERRAARRARLPTLWRFFTERRLPPAAQQATEVA